MFHENNTNYPPEAGFAILWLVIVVKNVTGSALQIYGPA